jgi:hypothetical protein
MPPWPADRVMAHHSVPHGSGSLPLDRQAPRRSEPDDPSRQIALGAGWRRQPATRGTSSGAARSVARGASERGPRSSTSPPPPL